jgi:hypothetical protein
LIWGIILCIGTTDVRFPRLKGDFICFAGLR